MGFDEVISYGNGMVLLFYGPSGTGKTMMVSPSLYLLSIYLI
jgi:predicted ATPase with chaperone activity